MVNGNKVQTSKLAVDAADELADLAFEFRRVGESGGCNLNEHNSANPLGVVVQEFGKRAELLYDTFHDVELVSSNDDLFTGVQLKQSLQLGLNSGSSTWSITSAYKNGK